MATKTILNGDFTNLIPILRTYFNSVEQTQTAGIYYLTCTSGNLIFKIGGFNDASQWNIYAKSGISEHDRGTSGGDGQDYYVDSVYECERGISIVCRSARILICKNNRGKTMVAFGESEPRTAYNTLSEKTAAVMNTICAIADGDNDTYKFFINNTYAAIYDREFNQTLPISIPTQAGYGETSFSVGAKLLLLPQSRGIGSFLYDGKKYFSDGYFAIEDQEV